MAFLTENETRVLFDLDNKINALYEKKSELMKKLAKKYVDETEVHGIVKLDEATLKATGNVEDKPWLRVTFKDELKAITEGTTLYRNTGFNRYSIGVSLLKNEPKEKLNS